MITKEMTIGAIIRNYPDALPIMERYGLDCSDCQIADLETLEHGAGVHGICLEELLRELTRL